MATISVKAAWNRGLILLVVIGVLINYIDRGTVGVAAPLLKTDLHLSATQFGIAVSAFFWVYVPAGVLVGWACDRICVYRLFAASLALWALATTLTGFAGGLGALIALRLLLGLGESIAFPGSSKLIARHVPDHRRGLANAGMAAAIAVGPAIGTLAGGLIMASFGWRTMFVAFGLGTFLWLVPWRQAVRPLLAGRPGRREAPLSPLLLVRTPAMWVMMATHFAANFGFYFILSWLPLYLVQSRGYSIVQMTMLATTLYAVQAASSLFVGWWSDHLITGGHGEGQVRRLMLTAGFLVNAVAIVGIGTSSSSLALILWLLLAGSTHGFGAVNLYAVGQIFAGPRAAGSWIGLQNGFGNLAGIVGPVITGMIIEFDRQLSQCLLSHRGGRRRGRLPILLCPTGDRTRQPGLIAARQFSQRHFRAGDARHIHPELEQIARLRLLFELVGAEELAGGGGVDGAQIRRRRTRSW